MRNFSSKYGKVSIRTSDPRDVPVSRETDLARKGERKKRYSSAYIIYEGRLFPETTTTTRTTTSTLPRQKLLLRRHEVFPGCERRGTDIVLSNYLSKSRRRLLDSSRSSQGTISSWRTDLRIRFACAALL